MSLTQALNAARSGLAASQAGIDVTSRNIANANTVGYTAKSVDQTNLIVAGESRGVTRLAAQRHVDAFLQQQIRTENATTSALTAKADMLTRIDRMFGSPDSETSISASIDKLAGRLSDLITSPEDSAARLTFLNQAQHVATDLNSMSRTVQDMRLEAEQNIADDVAQANTLLKQVANLNQQISQRVGSSLSAADLQDQRDLAINELSKLMDIRVNERDDGTVTVFTGGGQLLLDKTPAELSFDQHTQINASSVYDADPAKRTVGTISLVSGSTKIDLVAAGAFEGGSIGGYLELRDEILPEAQDQLDEIASQLALSLSQEKVDGTAATSGAASGFDLDTGALQDGNSISLTYEVGGTSQTVTFVRVDDTSALPLSDTDTAQTGDTVVGIDFNQPMADIVADMQAALPPSVQVSNPSGNTIRILDDGAAGTSDITSLSATVTPTSPTDSGTGLALFVDGEEGKFFTNAQGAVDQKTGFAARITLNPDVVEDDSLLVTYQTAGGTNSAGDSTRPVDLYNRLTQAGRAFSPSTGIGGTSSPYTGSIASFAQRVVSYQSTQASNAKDDLASQEIVSQSLQDRFDSETGVNVDNELSSLLVLQNAYSANARVMTTVSQLFDVLMSIGR
ncbi:flagellar hook-associated protein 1 FlgK [Parvibaculum indicum]|uniref:flagellar hook-associated protein FlgK n=1 Tax=Parvibaculum indicum TaxID=562969 RepID=UPI0014234AAC|nr:flagellar hook-associated protein FlgK [Parvibaculum indicum]NIJ41127.1 flagellar hook-associated protein 1 FlgK [Parvibaculum indicum]